MGKTLTQFFKNLGFFGSSTNSSSNGVDELESPSDNWATSRSSSHAVKTMIRTRCGYVSITGNFRSNNEDNLHVDPEGRFFIVADGMGGQSAGEKAP